MRIVFLNTWHGKLDEAISGLLPGFPEDTDVFCFQETDGLMKDICSRLLTSYNNYSFRKQVNEKDACCLMTLVKKELPVTFFVPVLEEDPEIGFGAVTELRFPAGL